MRHCESCLRPDLNSLTLLRLTEVDLGHRRRNLRCCFDNNTIVFLKPVDIGLNKVYNPDIVTILLNVLEEGL